MCIYCLNYGKAKLLTDNTVVLKTTEMYYSITHTKSSFRMALLPWVIQKSRGFLFYCSTILRGIVFNCMVEPGSSNSMIYLVEEGKKSMRDDMYFKAQIPKVAHIISVSVPL